jgi:hypothetical protein
MFDSLSMDKISGLGNDVWLPFSLLHQCLTPQIPVWQLHFSDKLNS